MTGRGKGLERWLGVVHRLEDGLLALLLGTIILLAATQIVLRNLFHSGFVWADPLLRLLVLWVGMLGALAASRQHKHIAIDVFSRLLPQRARVAAQAVTSLFTAIVAALVAYHAVRFVMMDFEAHVVAFAGLPAWPGELVIPFAFAMIALRYLLLFIIQAKTLMSAKTPA